LNKVSGDVRVRLAQDGEKLVLLDESEVALAEDVLVIADQDGPLAMAGIMGGLDSGVTQQSTSILLESAYFDPIAIAGRARRFGLHTDSSQRFERGVDPGLQADAIELATRLILDICGGDCGPVMDIRSPNHIDARKPIRLRQKMIERVLGFSLEESKVVDILQRLGMKLDKNEEGWSVTPPSHRFDMEIEVDLIEELARVYGYNNIQTRAPEAEIHLNPVTENITPLERIQSLLVARDYQEAITYSFVDPKWQNALEPDTKPYPLSNPISADLSVMRTSIWAGLLKCVHYNLNRQQSRVRLFETGLTFVPENGGIKQQPKLAGVACGNRSDIHWSIDNKTSVDFYDVKGDLEALLIAGNPQRQVGFEIGQHSALHPGQTAKIVVDGNTVGLLGAIHPKVAQDLDVPKSTYLFEIELSAVVEAELPNYQPFSRFPANKRDLAFVVDENTLVGDMVSAIRANNSEILQEVAVFDVYTGQGVEKGQKSVAFTLTIQHPSTTLTDEEMSDLIESIVSSVTTQFSARLRE
jgi:phenylalanyl-tRNA synthetase beta chain